MQKRGRNCALPGHLRGAIRDEANDDGAERVLLQLELDGSAREANENRQRIDSKRERHPAEQAELDDIEKKRR